MSTGYLVPGSDEEGEDSRNDRITIEIHDLQ
jgi:hypothetical protein